MDQPNLAPDHPLKNPGIEAALIRLGHAITDYATAKHDVPEVKQTDKSLMLLATSHLGITTLSVMPATVAVVMIDGARETIEQATPDTAAA